MSTIKQSIYVEFNGETSDSYNILNVNMSSSLQQEGIWGARSIVKTKVSGRDKPFFHRIDSDVFKFTLQLAFNDSFTDEDLHNVYRWLRTDFYAPLRFSERSNMIYFCILVDEPQLYHTTANQGYIEANFECDSPYAYSDVLSYSIDLSSNSSGHDITLYNNGDLPINMDFDVTAVGAGNISIANNSNNGETITFTGLNDGEEINFDSQNEIIESTSPGYRFSVWNNVNPTLTVGKNILHVTGNCKLKITYQYKMFAG